MAKITFVGAGSAVFAKNILGDAMLHESMHDAHIALYDINPERLEDADRMINAVNNNCNEKRATITSHLGIENLEDALRGSDFVVNAVQIGGYDPCTIADFEIPKKYGLEQTIADTLGIGGIFRSLRTIPVLQHVHSVMEKVCPTAIFLNYTNPMCAITGSLLKSSSIQTVGLCHSVQGCAAGLLGALNLSEKYDPAKTKWNIAGINHQAWLLDISYEGKDIYPEIKSTARALVDEVQARGAGKWINEEIIPKLNIEGEVMCFAIPEIAQKVAEEGKLSQEDADLVKVAYDMVRLEFMFQFGHYVTESSEHNAEYSPWFIKKGRQDLIDKYNIPLDEYPRRSREQIRRWAEQRKTLIDDPNLEHSMTCEFGAPIMNAVLTNTPLKIAGNVLNTGGLIENLPGECCVEVPCLVDANGIQPTYVGKLPVQCAAMNQTNINPQLLTMEAALTGKKDLVYQAALLDPHTSAELSIDEIRNMCDDLFEAHKQWLPAFT